MTDGRDFHFDGWTLRTRSGELTRGDAVHRLPQQPLRVLVELLEHAGDVVTRERLVQVLWPKGVVDFDNSLNAVLRKLRVALGDDSDTPRYIETLPRIGYRFVGKLETAPVSKAQPRAGRKRVLLFPAAALLAVVLAGAWWVASRRHASSVRVDPAAPASSQKRVTSQRAYEFFLNGKFHRSRRDINGAALAVASFEAALKEDPYFVEAWAALAETYSGEGITQHKPLAQAMEQARRAAQRAIELDPDASTGHAALAAIKLHYDFDLEGAERELLAAKQADDRNARMWHTWGLLRGYQGRLEEAFEYVGRAREIEPTSLLYAANYGNLLYQSRRFDEAVDYLRPLIASQPRFDQARGILIRALAASGRIGEALEQLPLRFSEIPVLSDDGMVFALAGRPDDARRQIERLERRAKEGFAMSYELAVVHASLGALDEACQALDRARLDRSQTQGWMRLDPRMDPLRGRQCFADAQKRLYGPK